MRLRQMSWTSIWMAAIVIDDDADDAARVESNTIELQIVS